MYMLSKLLYGNKLCHLRNISEIVDITDLSYHSGTDGKNAVLRTNQIPLPNIVWEICIYGIHKQGILFCKEQLATKFRSSKMLILCKCDNYFLNHRHVCTGKIFVRKMEEFSLCTNVISNPSRFQEQNSLLAHCFINSISCHGELC